MSGFEGIAEFIQSFDTTEAKRLRDKLGENQELFQNAMLRNSLVEYGRSIVQALHNPLYKQAPAMRDGFISTLFQQLIADVRRHPQYKDIIGIEYDKKRVVMPNGELADKAAVLTQPTQRIMTLEDIRGIVAGPTAEKQ